MNKVALHHLQIYNFRLVVGVYDSEPRMCKLVHPWVGDITLKGFAGSVAYQGRSLCILLHRPSLCHEVIAHECFHATHRIMEWCGARMHKKEHEAHAHLCGAISEIVYCDLKQWGCRIKTKSDFDLTYQAHKTKE